VAYSKKPYSYTLGNGKYEWFIEIPRNKLPCTVYFVVDTQKTGVQNTRGEIDGIWIKDENSLIDLGLINYNVVWLSGVLPVTINGEPVGAYLTIQMPDSYYGSSARINEDGSWEYYTVSPDTETPLTFYVSTGKNTEFYEISFSKKLISDTVYTINGTDAVYIFPEYPSINFEAFYLFGTIKIRTPEGYQPYSSTISFYKEGEVDYSYENQLGHARIKFLQDKGDGSAVWTTMVRTFPLPQKLQFYLHVSHGNWRHWHKSTIDITESTNLLNINLGNFTKWDN